MVFVVHACMGRKASKLQAKRRPSLGVVCFSGQNSTHCIVYTARQYKYVFSILIDLGVFRLARRTLPAFLFLVQYGIAALQFFTTVGSTLFHLTRETKFFNLDNVFATSLLITTTWGLFLAAWNGEHANPAAQLPCTWYV